MQCTIGKTCIVRDALRHVLTRVLHVPAEAVLDGDGAGIAVRWCDRDYVGVLPLVHVLRRCYAVDAAARQFLGTTDATSTALVNQWLTKAAQLCVDATQYNNNSKDAAATTAAVARNGSNDDLTSSAAAAAAAKCGFAATLYMDVERAIEASKLHSGFLAGTTHATIADVLLCAAVCNHPCSPYNNSNSSSGGCGCCCVAESAREQLLLHGATVRWCQHACTADAQLQSLGCCRVLQQAVDAATVAAAGKRTGKQGGTATGGAATTTATAAAVPKPVFVKPSEEDILRRRREKEAERAAKAAAKAAAAAAATATTTTATATAEGNGKTTAVDAADATQSLSIDAVDVRVGRFSNVRVHPQADRLYVEDMQLGDEVRTIVSGLVQHYTREQLEGELCLVVCNMKPRALKGVTSQGMLLCALGESHGSEGGGAVCLLRPPAGAQPGDRIVFAQPGESAAVAAATAAEHSSGSSGATQTHKPLKEGQMSELLSHLRLDDEARLSWKGRVARHAHGIIAGPASMTGCRVS